MSLSNADCPDISLLSDFCQGKLAAASAASIDAHLADCATCRARVMVVRSAEERARERGSASDAPPVDEVNLTRTYGADAGGSVSMSVSDEGTPVEPADLFDPPEELLNHPDYELIKELGRGGMGVVYLARNLPMDRMEVLKVVNKSRIERPKALERFQKEIRSAARLQHPNIVTAYSVMRLGPTFIFAMEYVPGEDLAHTVKRRGPMPVTNAAFYGHEAALGLQHAFEKGMVHRDIKPGNLMLFPDGNRHIVKILDFGLARATSEDEAETGITREGQLLGTPDYIAPEQTVSAQKADIRADIYSLGCTIYFLITGRTPFEGGSLFETLQAHHTQEASPLHLERPDVPPEFSAVIARMMAKNPADRFQEPADVARALEPFFRTTPTVLPHGGALPVAVSVPQTVSAVGGATTVGASPLDAARKSRQGGNPASPAKAADFNPPTGRPAGGSSAPAGSPSPKSAPAGKPASAPKTAPGAGTSPAAKAAASRPISPSPQRPKDKRSKSSADTHSNASSKSLSELMDWNARATASAAEHQRRAIWRQKIARKVPPLLAGVVVISVVAWVVMAMLGGGEGILAIQVTEPNALVTIDEQLLNITWEDGGTAADIMLAAGKHDVVVRKPGFEPFHTSVDVPSDGRFILRAQMTPR